MYTKKHNEVHVYIEGKICGHVKSVYQMCDFVQPLESDEKESTITFL